jgi:hypothetical protein
MNAWFYVGGTNAAGTIIDANTTYVGMQSQGNNNLNPEDLAEVDGDPVGQVNTRLHVGLNAVLKVNDTMHLGYTTADLGDHRKADQGWGAVYINGGTVIADYVVVDELSGNDQRHNHLPFAEQNGITLTDGGELLILSQAGEDASRLSGLNVTDSTLVFQVDGTKTDPYIYTDELNTAGLANTIRLDSVVNVTTFPTQLPLIDYNTASPNFGVEMPSGYYGYVVNNEVARTIDVVITINPPSNLVWDGTVGSNWDTTTANWQGGATFVNGDSVTFDDSASGTTSVQIDDMVIPAGDGVIVNNWSKNYSLNGVGAIAGTAPMVKTGSGRLSINVANQLPLNHLEGLVNGSGSIGATTVGTNATLTFAGTLNRLSSSGTVTLLAGSKVENGVIIDGGTFTNAGHVVGAVDLIAGEAEISGRVTSMGPSRVGEGVTLKLDGEWINEDASARFDVFGLLIGSGKVTDKNRDLTAAPPPGSQRRLSIGSGGVLDPGAYPGDIVTFIHEGRFDFVAGSTIYIDVDLNDPNGNDTIQADRWSTMEGELVMINVGSVPFSAGQEFEVFRHPYGEWGFPNIPLNEDHLPVMVPAIPGLGLHWDLSLFRTNGIVSIVGGGPTEPPPVNWGVTNGILSLSWPEDYSGWQVYAQTNGLDVGLSTNWVPVPGTANSTSFEVEVVETNAAVFYQLGLPASSP